jgi:hypothetical protein
VAALLGLVLAVAAAFIVLRGSGDPVIHGPDDGPLRGASYALTDSLHGDPDGTLGQLSVSNSTDLELHITKVYALGVTPNRVRLSNLRMGTGTSEFVYKNDMEIDRVDVRPFGDGTVAPRSTDLDNAILIDFVIEGGAPVEILGYRVDYEGGDDRYSAYWPIYQCLAVDDDRIDECRDLPILALDELRELSLTEVAPG